MRRIVVNITGAIFVVTALVVTAEPHSWYPYQCCGDGDCHVTDDVKKVSGGFLSEGYFVPNAMIKASPDGQFHICYQPAIMGLDGVEPRKRPKPICFWAPKEIF